MIIVDFNDLEDSRIEVLASSSDIPLVLGQRVLLSDGENVCSALIEDAGGEISTLLLDWSTWNRKSSATPDR